MTFDKINDDKKEKIINVSLRLFAINGYDPVSMKDISKAAGVTQGAIYNYFSGKNELMESAMSRFEQEYMCYFDWLIKANEKAETLEEVMDNMFVELLKVRDLSIYHGISLLLKEQFTNETARKRLLKLIYVDSTNWMQADLDRLMTKGVIPRGDSRTIATILMWCVLAGTEMRIHESIGNKLPVDCTEMYANLKTFLTAALRKGV